MNLMHCFVLILFYIALAQTEGDLSTAIDSDDLGLAQAEDLTTTEYRDDLVPTTLEPLESSRESRIVGGNNALPVQFPHQIALYKNRTFTCGGSLISSDYALTAAHCVTTAEPQGLIPASALSIRAGSLSLHSGGQIVEVSSVRVHPEFDNFENDIAVLKLSHPLQLNLLVRPIDLATRRPPSGAKVAISGWGTLWEGGPLANILQHTVLKVISNAKCRRNIGPVAPSILCLAHPVGIGACHGDSGGPGVYKNRLVGITSFVGLCASKTPDGYTSVADHITWIKQQLSY